MKKNYAYEVFYFTLVVFTITLIVSDVFADQQVTIIAGGDIEWSCIIKEPEVYYSGKVDNRWERIKKRVKRKLGIRVEDIWQTPYLATLQGKEYIEKQFNRKLETSNSHHIEAIKYDIKFITTEDRDRYPFRKIAPLLRKADIAFANLETPLADNSRYNGYIRTPTSFAKALKWAGIDLVSIANNHTLDAEGAGLLETKKALLGAGIGAVGGGRNLMDARQPFIVEKEGILIAFFGYTQGVNGGRGGFALSDRSGVMPLDAFLIKEDIKSVRDIVDFVVLSFHWGSEKNKQNIHPGARNFAHAAIDAGADIILGHHPHVPRGIELYKGKVIIYSLGNFIFSHNHDYWMDNLLACITVTKSKILKVEIIPISGKGDNLGQPYPLEGNSANILLNDIKMRSEELNTGMAINRNVGIVIEQPKTESEEIPFITLMVKLSFIGILVISSAFLIIALYVVIHKKKSSL